MRRESLALTEQIGALAANGEYVKLMTVSGELLEETEAVGAQDFTQPTAAIPDCGHGRYAEKGCVGSRDGAPWRGNHGRSPVQVERRLFRQPGKRQPGRCGAGRHECAERGKSYREPGNWPGDSLVILEYGNGYTSMVTFMQTGEGVISAEASLAKDGEGDATALLLQLLGVGDEELEPFGTP